MQLYEFTTVTNQDGLQIVRVAARIADHPDPAQQKEYITFQFSVGLTTVRNGARLRQEVLEKARDILTEQAQVFETIVRQTER